VGRGCVCRVAWQFVLVAMAQRVEVGRAGGGVLRPAAFIALRSRSGRVVVDAKDPVDMARLLMAWTGLGSDVALICSFEHRRQATSWGTGPLPALPEWASRTCVPEGRAAVVRIGDAPPRTSVFALLRGVGGHLAVVDDASMVVKLVNTISDLNGECALARLMPSTPDSESWLLAPRVPQWLLSSSSAASSGRAAAGEDAVISVTDDGVIVLSDDESDDDAERNAFSKAARALPPAPTTNRAILSMGSLEDGRLLPLAFQRHPVTGLLVRGGGRAASKPVTPVNDDSSTSLLTPPRRAPSSTSVETTASAGHRSPGRPPLVDQCGLPLSRWALCFGGDAFGLLVFKPGGCRGERWHSQQQHDTARSPRWQQHYLARSPPRRGTCNGIAAACVHSSAVGSLCRHGPSDQEAADDRRRAI